MLDSSFYMAFLNIGKSDLPAVDRYIQRYFDKCAGSQFILHKFFYDTAHTETDFGKLYQKEVVSIVWLV